MKNSTLYAILGFLLFLLMTAAANAKPFGEEVKVYGRTADTVSLERRDRTHWTCPASAVRQEQGKDVVAMKDFLPPGQCKEARQTFEELKKKANTVSPELAAQVRHAVEGQPSAEAQEELFAAGGGLYMRRKDGTVWQCTGLTANGAPSQKITTQEFQAKCKPGS